MTGSVGARSGTRSDGAVAAVIVAGGMGTRFGDARGKQLVPLLGRPLLAWTVAAFEEAPSIRHIVIVCAPAQRDATIRQLSADDGLMKGVTPRSYVPGGPTRQESVARGLEALPPSQFDVVAVHDGARPLVTAGLIERVIGALRDDDRLAASIAASPVTDTLKIVEHDMVLATADRAAHWSAMTPQVCRTDVLRAAYLQAAADGFVGTDDASIIEHAGGRVRCVPVSRDNIKVTVPEDLAIAEAILRLRVMTGRPASNCTARP